MSSKQTKAEKIDAHIAGATYHEKSGQCQYAPGVMTRYSANSSSGAGYVNARHCATGRRVRVSWQPELGSPENHERAARHCFYSAAAASDGGRTDYSRDPLLACSIDDGGYVFVVGS